MSLAVEIKRFSDTGEYSYLSHVMNGYISYEPGKEFDELFKESFSTMNIQRLEVTTRISFFHSSISSKLLDKDHNSLKSFLGDISLEDFERCLSVSLLLFMTFTVPNRVKLLNIHESKAKQNKSGGYALSFLGIYPYLDEDKRENSDDTPEIFAGIYNQYIKWVRENVIDNSEGTWEEKLKKVIKAFNHSRLVDVLERTIITGLQEADVKYDTQVVFREFDKVTNFLLVECFDGMNMLTDYTNDTFTGNIPWLLQLSYISKPFAFLADQLTMKPDLAFKLLTLANNDVLNFCIMPLEVKAVFDDVTITAAGGSNENFELLMQSSVFAGVMDECLRYTVFRGTGLGSLVFVNDTNLVFIHCEVDFDSINLDKNGKIHLQEERSLNKKKVPVKVKVFVLSEIDNTFVSCFIQSLVSLRKRLLLYFKGLSHPIEEDLIKSQRDQILKKTLAIISALKKSPTPEGDERHFQNRVETRSMAKRRRTDSSSDAKERSISLHVWFKGDTPIDYGIGSFGNSEMTPYKTFEKLGIFVPPYYNNYLPEYFGWFRSLIMTLSSQTFLKFLIPHGKKDDVLTYTEAAKILKNYDKIVIKVINIEMQRSLFQELKIFENFDTVDDYLRYGSKVHHNEIKIMMMIQNFNERHHESLRIKIPDLIFHGTKFYLFLSREKFNGFIGPYILMNHIEQTKEWKEILPLNQVEIDVVKSSVERLIRMLHIRHGDLALRNMIYNHGTIFLIDFGSSKIIKVKKENIEEIVQTDTDRVQYLLGNPYKD